MTKNIACLMFVFILILIEGRAQINEDIKPIWSNSFGSKEHTSRDELLKIDFDNDSNIILAGSVERDSSFSDVLIQKFTKDGTKLWHHRFSSGKYTDYDKPVDFVVDNKNNVFVLESFATNVNHPSGTFNDVIKGGLMLYKLNENGKLIWEKEIPDITPDYTIVKRIHISINEDNSICIIFFLNQLATGEFPIYNITEDGTLTKTEMVSNKNLEGNVGEAKLITCDKNGTQFIFNKAYNKLNYWISEIKGVNSTVYQLDNAEIQDSKLKDRENDSFKSDSEGNTYIFGNSGYPEYLYYVYKITTGGKIHKYLTFYGDHKVGIENICINDSNVFMIGRHTDNLKKTHTFIVKLDKKLNAIDSIFLGNYEHYIPQSITTIENTIYAILDNDTTGRSIVLAFDNALRQTSKYILNYPPGYDFRFSNLLKGKNKVYIAGTIRRQKFFESDYFSEEEYYIETFSIRTDTDQTWNYIFSDSGTSNVDGASVFTTSCKGTYVLDHEAQGPECLSCLGAPKINYLMKYDSLGIRLWQTPIDFELTNNLVAMDQKDNFYTLGLQNNKHHLIGINPEGKYIFQKLIDFIPISLYAGKNRNLYVSSKEDCSPFCKIYMNVFDTLLNFVQKVKLRGEIIQIFELPNNDSIYYYTFDEGSWGDTRKKEISLYVNNNLRWSRVVDMSSPYRGYETSDYNKKNGCLYFVSQWASINKYIQRLTMDNHHSYTTLENGHGDFKSINSLSNGNLLVNMEQQWKLYTEDLKHSSLKTLDFLAEKILVLNNHEFLVGNGKVLFFDYNFEKLGEISNPKFNRSFSYCINDVYDLHTINQYGLQLPIGWSNFMFGYRTYNGIISKFELSAISDFRTPILSDPKFSIENLVYNSDVQQPSNPPQTTKVEEVPNLQFWHFLKNDNLVINRSTPSYPLECTIWIFDTRGRKMMEAIWQKGEQTISLSMQNLNSGLYIIQIVEKTDLIYRAKFIK